MELLTLILEIRYKQLEVSDVDDKRVELVELITGEKPKKPPGRLAKGMVINHETTKTRVVIEENRIAVSVEKPDISEAKSRLSEVLTFIYRKFPYKDREIIRLGARTNWIWPWSQNFTSLVSRFKEIFYKESSLSANAFDVGLPLIFKEENYRVNYSAGPMKPNQGKSFIIFKNRNLPHDFLFVDVDNFVMDEPIDNRLVNIKNFVTSSIVYGQEKAEETVSLIEGE